MSAQTPERLLFDDESLPLLGEPLAPWLAQERLLVHGAPAACRRGYVGTWRLHGTRLCLVSLAPAGDGAHLQRERDERPLEISMAALFGSDRPVWAEWFSGRLCCPQLPCLRYSDYGIPQPAQHDLVIELAAGRARRIGFETTAEAQEATAPDAATIDAGAHAAAAPDTGWHWPWPMPEWRLAMRRWHLLPHRPARSLDVSTTTTPDADAALGELLFERHPHAALIADADGRVLRANAAAHWLASRGPDTPLGELMRRAGPRAGSPEGWHGRVTLQGQDGSREVAADVLPLPAGRFLCLLGPAEAARAARTRSGDADRDGDGESHFRTLADSAPVMVWVCGADRLIEWVNRPWLAYTGRTLAQERGNGWFDGAHDEDLERVTGIFDTAFDARMPFTMDYRLRRHDGSYRYISNHGVPRYAPDGSFLGYIGSCFDVHERKDLEERLAERTRALRLADRRKNEFLAMLSHELRNPLAPIANAAGILRLMERDNPPLVRVRQIIDRQVEQMRRLVGDLVDVTRLTHGKIALHKEHVLLDDMVRSAVESAQARLDAGGHTLRIDLPEARVVIEGDSVRLAQALANLIANAAKFTPTPSVIDIAARTTRNVLRVTVSDTGQGIRADFLPHVFDLFAQQDQSLARTQGGLGVGLTIAQRIAHLHGGEIDAASDGPGHGAQFVLSLPLARHAPAPQRREADAIDAPRGYRVLLIEDNADSRDVLRLLLEIGGNEVMSAANADEGLRLAGQFLPQIVLCDLGLPGTDGYQLIAPLRKKLAGHATLFAALTGHGREEDEARALAAGFDSFLVKPLQPDGLGRLLRSYASKLH